MKILTAAVVAITVGSCEARDDLLHGTCTPAVEPHTVLGGTDGEGSFVSAALSVSVLVDGRFLVYDWNEVSFARGSLKAFRSDGSFVGLVGTPGEGPGEYARPHLAVSTHGGERLAVFDPVRARITYLSLDGADVISTHSLPPFVNISSVIALGDDRFIVNGRLFADPQALGQPLHLLDTRGNLVRSFGADPPIQGDLRDSNAFQRRTTLSKDGTVLSAGGTEYRVERWDTTGIRTAADVVREVDWLVPQDERRSYGLSRSEPPTPGIQAIWEDDDGRLWVLSRVPADDWWDRARTLELATGETRYVPERAPGDLFDTHVDVWDPSASEVIAEARIPMGLWGARSGFTMLSSTDDRGLFPQIEVMRLELKC